MCFYPPLHRLRRNFRRRCAQRPAGTGPHAAAIAAAATPVVIVAVDSSLAAVRTSAISIVCTIAVAVTVDAFKLLNRIEGGVQPNRGVATVRR